eukprot:scaffold272675_cov31-Tisochrysis_lutea.AAC.10
MSETKQQSDGCSLYERERNTPSSEGTVGAPRSKYSRHDWPDAAGCVPSRGAGSCIWSPRRIILRALIEAPMRFASGNWPASSTMSVSTFSCITSLANAQVVAPTRSTSACSGDFLSPEALWMWSTVTPFEHLARILSMTVLSPPILSARPPRLTSDMTSSVLASKLSMAACE